MPQVARATAVAADPIDPVAQAIAAYPRHAATTFAAAIATAAVSLPEPITTEPRRALKLLDPLVEVLTGFALGSLADGVILGVRRWFGFDAADAVRVGLARWPATGFARDELTPPYLADAHARPLVDELAARLHARSCRAAPELHRLSAITAAALGAGDAEARVKLAGMLAAITRDSLIHDRIASEIDFGWRVFHAALAGAPPPSTAGRSQRSCALWHGWWSRRSGARPAVDPDAIIRAGYILQIG